MSIEGKDVGELSLQQIAHKVRENADAHRHVRVEYALQQGELLSAGRKLCGDRECGIEGDNPDARFGRWVSENFSDTFEHSRTAYNYRQLFENFGALGAEMVAKIGLSRCYSLNMIEDDLKKLVVEAAQELPPGSKLSSKEYVRILNSKDPELAEENERAEKWERERAEGTWGSQIPRLLDTKSAIFTSEEFKLISACLHPDGNLSQEKRTKAFQAFTNQEKRLT